MDVRNEFLFFFSLKMFTANYYKNGKKRANHLKKLLELFPSAPWSWYRLSSNPNITLEIVQNNPTKPWDWYNLSSNPNITWEIIQKNMNKPWNWHGLSR